MNINDNLITKVAWYYYMENMTQEQIAALIGISRFKIIKLLDQARKESIVQFKIRGKGVHCLHIENDIKARYALKDVFVTPRSPNSLINSLSLAASQYLEDLIKNDDIIGFGWGETISKTIMSLNVDPELKTSFVSLTGGVKYYIPSNDGYSIGNVNGRLYVMPTPFYMSTEEMAAQTLSEPSVKVIVDMALMANFVLVGIGTITNNATIVKENIISEDEMEILKRQGAVGDILGQFYDANGNKLDADIHKRIMGIDINTLKTKSMVIGVAGGPLKVEAIKGAIRGGYINVLITDEDTAEQLITD